MGQVADLIAVRQSDDELGLVAHAEVSRFVAALIPEADAHRKPDVVFVPVFFVNARELNSGDTF